MTPFLKIFYFSLVVLLLLNTSLFAQPIIPHIEWAGSFGGSESDQAQCIEQTSDKGFIVAGSSFSNDLDIVGHHGDIDNADYWLVKLDSNGSLLWQQSLGGAGDDVANSIKQTPDGGYIVAGYSTSHNFDVSGNHGGEDYWIVRLDGNGKIIWQKSFGGTKNERAYSIELTTDGGYVIAGASTSNDGDVTKHHGDTTNTDYWIIKIDRDGNLRWQKSLGGFNNDVAYSIRQTADRGFIIAGSSYSVDTIGADITFSHGTVDFWVVKLDSMGVLKWQRSYGGSQFDEAYSIDLTSDGGYIAAGYTTSVNGDVTKNFGQSDVWIIKLDSIGNLMWQKSAGGSDIDGGLSIKQTFDRGYILAGSTVSNDDEVHGNHGGNDYWVLKLDSTGNLQWQKTLGGPGEEFALSIIQTADSGYVVAGSSDFDGGDVNGNHNHEDFWIVKLGSKEMNTVIPSKNPSYTFTNFPNPFSDKTTLVLPESIKGKSFLFLYNLLGEELRRITIPEKTNRIVIEREGLTNGVFVYRLICEGRIIGTGNIIVGQ